MSKKKPPTPKKKTARSKVKRPRRVGQTKLRAQHQNSQEKLIQQNLPSPEQHFGDSSSSDIIKPRRKKIKPLLTWSSESCPSHPAPSSVIVCDVQADPCSPQINKSLLTGTSDNSVLTDPALSSASSSDIIKPRRKNINPLLTRPSESCPSIHPAPSSVIVCDVQADPCSPQINKSFLTGTSDNSVLTDLALPSAIVCDLQELNADITVDGIIANDPSLRPSDFQQSVSREETAPTSENESCADPEDYMRLLEQVRISLLLLLPPPWVPKITREGIHVSLPARNSKVLVIQRSLLVEPSGKIYASSEGKELPPTHFFWRQVRSVTLSESTVDTFTQNKLRVMGVL